MIKMISSIQISLLLTLTASFALAELEQSDVDSRNSPSLITTTTTTTTGVNTQTTQEQLSSKLLKNRFQTTTSAVLLDSSQPQTTTDAPFQSSNSPSSSSVAPEESLYQYMKPLILPKCYHNNKTYSIGQRWNDDCIQVCECITINDGGLQAISSCRNRCPPYTEPPMGCSLQRSKTDECCLESVCDPEGKSTGQATTTTIMNTDFGQLNVSTTEIRMPSPTQPPTTTTPSPSSSSIHSGSPFTTTMTTAAFTQVTTKIPIAITSQQQVPTTTQTPQPNTMPTTTTTKRATSGITNQPNTSNRAPKQVSQTITQRVPLQTTILPPMTTPQAAAQTTTRNINHRILDEDAPSTTTTSSTINSTDAEDLSEPLADPELDDLCIVGERGGYKVNDSWIEEPCNRICRCVFRSEPRNIDLDVQIQLTINFKEKSEQTELRCSLPEHCGSIRRKLIPTPQCLYPRLVLPQMQIEGECGCPVVNCLPPLSSMVPIGIDTTPPILRPSITTTLAPPQTTASLLASIQPVRASSTRAQDTTSTTSTTTTSTTTPSTTTLIIKSTTPSTTTTPPTTTTTPSTTTTTTTTTTTAATPPSTTTTTAPPSTTAQSTTTEQPSVDIESSSPAGKQSNNDIIKSTVSSIEPCYNNNIDIGPLPWTDQIHSQVNGSIQKYAWHLLFAFFAMTVSFIIVLLMYLKKSTHVIPIASQTAYDNPTFTRLVSYYANQPHVLLVDENKQNFNNDAIMAERKTLELELDQPPQLHHHILHHNNRQMNDVHHNRG